MIENSLLIIIENTQLVTYVTKIHLLSL